MPMLDAPVTVGITTNDRPGSLRRCLASLRLLGAALAEVIIIDDASSPPVDLTICVTTVGGATVRVIRLRPGESYIHGRNTIVTRAGTDLVLLLDDDAALLDVAAVQSAADVLNRDPAVAIVGFAQAEMDGAPWPIAMQPAPVDFPCQVTSHIGFAHMVRRETFLSLGGYRATLEFYGEERELALRCLDAGYRVVYLPEARVAHVPDPAGRSPTRYIRYAVRSACLAGLYNEPFPVLAATLPVRLAGYFAMRRHSGTSDPGGFRWILHSLGALLPDIRRERRAVRWRTMWRWRGLRRQPRPYQLHDARPSDPGPVICV